MLMELRQRISAASVDPALVAIATGIHPARMRQILAGTVVPTPLEVRRIDAYLVPYSQAGYNTRSPYTKGQQ